MGRADQAQQPSWTSSYLAQPSPEPNSPHGNGHDDTYGAWIYFHQIRQFGQVHPSARDDPAGIDSKYCGCAAAIRSWTSATFESPHMHLPALFAATTSRHNQPAAARTDESFQKKSQQLLSSDACISGMTKQSHQQNLTFCVTAVTLECHSYHSKLHCGWDRVELTNEAHYPNRHTVDGDCGCWRPTVVSQQRATQHPRVLTAILQSDFLCSNCVVTLISHRGKRTLNKKVPAHSLRTVTK